MRTKIILIAMFLLFILSISNTVFGFGQDNIEMHGFASQGYLISSDNNYLGNSSDGSYEYNEIGINFSVAINNSLRFGTQFFSRDLGDHGNNELGIDWAFLDYTFRDWLGFRAGKIKMPYGLYNRQRDADMLRTSILMPQSVYNEGSRDLVVAFHGFSLYGNKNLGALGYIDYELFGATLDIPSNTPILSEYFEMLKYASPNLYNTLVGSGMDHTDMTIGIKHIEGGMLVWNTPLRGLRIGVTNLIGEMSYELGIVAVSANLNESSVISAEYDLGDLTLSAERLKTVFDIDIQGMSAESEGYYCAVSWDIMKWITIGAAYGEYFPNANDKDGSKIQGLPDYYAWQKDITASIRLNVNEYLCFKFETHFYDGLGLVSIVDNPPEESEQNWNLYLFKTSLSF